MTYDFGVWLASLPTEVSLALLTALGMFAALIGTLVINALYAPAELQPNNEVGGIKLNFVSEVFAVTLALALIGAYELYTTARDNVQKEVATLTSLQRAALIYSEPDQQDRQERMQKSIRDYARAVAEKEWQTMSYGVRNFDVTRRFEEMTEAFLGADPMTPRQQALQQNTVQWVAQVNEYRMLRLTTISRSLVSLVWTQILFGIMLALVFPLFFGTQNVVAQGAMSMIVIAYLMLHLLVIVKLAYPFIGDTAISPRPFLELSQ